LSCAIFILIIVTSGVCTSSPPLAQPQLVRQVELHNRHHGMSTALLKAHAHPLHNTTQPTMQIKESDSRTDYDN
jgi:hypothetical protein